MTSKKFCVLVTLLLFPLVLFAQEAAGSNAASSGAKEIKNMLSAVKAANAGDYIVLRSGKKYVLTQEEIDIANGRFNYYDLSNVKTETLTDGTKVKNISEAHTAYIYPDGQAAHILKTSVSFTSYMENHIEKNYHIGSYIDKEGNRHDMQFIGSPRFKVFRASVQFQTLSNGREEVQWITVTAYNHEERNYEMNYFSTPGWVWGNVVDNTSYKRIGETRRIEFDVESEY